MALVARTHPYELVIQLADNSGKTTKKTFELQSADAATAATDSAAILAALIAVTEAVVKSYSINHVFVENALVLPASGVENENQALLSIRLASDPTKYAGFSIPAADPGIFVSASGAGANVVDTGNAAVNALVDLFTDTNEAYLSDGELADGSLDFSGKRRHVASRNS
jgi:hypothetical protein